MRWLGVAIVGCWLAVFAAPASAGDREDFNEAVTHKCDELAVHPDDSAAVGPGVAFDKIDAPAAVKACKETVSEL